TTNRQPVQHSTATFTGPPFALGVSSSRNHLRNRSRSGCHHLPRHCWPDSTSIASNVICRRCRSRPHTISIRDLLARARTFDRPNGCLSSSGGGPHTSNVLGHLSSAAPRPEPLFGGALERPLVARGRDE